MWVAQDKVSSVPPGQVLRCLNVQLETLMNLSKGTGQLMQNTALLRLLSDAPSMAT